MKQTQHTFNVKFGQDLDRFLQRYYIAVQETQSIHPRHPGLWPWLFEASKKLTVDTTPVGCREELNNIHITAVLLNIMLDEIADQLYDETLLDFAISMMQYDGDASMVPPYFAKFHSYLALIKDIWYYLLGKIKRSPQYLLLAGELDWAFYRYFQHLWGCARLNRTVKSGDRLPAISVDECIIATAPSMFCLVYGIINLMHLEHVFSDEIKTAEKFFIQMEHCAVLSNSITTWKTEAQNHDFTSVVIFWAQQYGVIDDKELYDPKQSFVQKIEQSAYRESLTAKMQQILNQVQDECRPIRTFHTDRYIRGMMEVHHMHLVHSSLLKWNSDNPTSHCIA